MSQPEWQKLSVTCLFLFLLGSKPWRLNPSSTGPSVCDFSSTTQLWLVNVSQQRSSLVNAVLDQPWGQSGRFFWRGGSSPPPGSAWWTEWLPPRSATPSARGNQTAHLQRPWNGDIGCTFCTTPPIVLLYRQQEQRQQLPIIKAYSQLQDEHHIGAVLVDVVQHDDVGVLDLLQDLHLPLNLLPPHPPRARQALPLFDELGGKL